MVSIEEIRKPIAEDFGNYEKTFAKAVVSDNRLLSDVFSLITTHKGKQLRPTLVLLAAAICRQITNKTLLAATALELMHTATLVHDDVVDESPIRRGLPSVNNMWGNKVAVLVGDYILSKTLEIVSQLRSVKIMSIVAQVGKALANGELMSLGTEKRGSNTTDIAGNTTEKEYFEIISGKTASLFAACCKAGAASAGATERQEAAMSIFGEHLGMCFQMQDDILDFSDSDELGKPTMHDIEEGKITLPLIISIKRAPSHEIEDIKQAIVVLQDKKASNEKRFKAEQDIKSFVLRYDGIRYTKQKIEEHRRQAIDILDIFEPSEIKKAMIDLLNFSISRMN